MLVFEKENDAAFARLHQCNADERKFGAVTAAKLKPDNDTAFAKLHQDNWRAIGG